MKIGLSSSRLSSIALATVSVASSQTLVTWSLRSSAVIQPSLYWPRMSAAFFS